MKRKLEIADVVICNAEKGGYAAFVVRGFYDVETENDPAYRFLGHYKTVGEAATLTVCGSGKTYRLFNDGKKKALR